MADAQSKEQMAAGIGLLKILARIAGEPIELEDAPAVDTNTTGMLEPLPGGPLDGMTDAQIYEWAGLEEAVHYASIGMPPYDLSTSVDQVGLSLTK